MTSMSSKRQSEESTHSHSMKPVKKNPKYWNPKNSTWSEAAYKRYLDVIPLRPDHPSLTSNNQGVYQNPLLKESMYPMTQATLKYHSTSDVQDAAASDSSLMSHNQVVDSSSHALHNPHQLNEASGTSHTLMSHNQGVGTPITFASFASHWDNIPKEVTDGLNAELKNYLPPNPDSNLIDEWYGDNGDDGSYYWPAYDVSELKERIQESDKHHCLKIVQYLRIDWIRLARRPRDRDGTYGNISIASTFLKDLIWYFVRKN